MDYSHRDPDGRPIHNWKAPTAYELAALAATFLAAGKSEDEAFSLARKTFARAEDELLDFEVLDERYQREMIDGLPDLVAEDAAKAEQLHRDLGVRPPRDDSFPVTLHAFCDGILPQRSKADRWKFLTDRVFTTFRKPPKDGAKIKNLAKWNEILLRVAEIRKWESPQRLAADAEALRSKKRRVKKQHKLRKLRT